MRDALKRLAAFLRGQLPQTPEEWLALAKIAADALRHGLDQLQPAPRAALTAPLSDAEAADRLDALAAEAATAGDPAEAQAFAWEALVPVLLDLLRRFRERRQGA